MESHFKPRPGLDLICRNHISCGVLLLARFSKFKTGYNLDAPKKWIWAGSLIKATVSLLQQKQSTHPDTIQETQQKQFMFGCCERCLKKFNLEKYIYHDYVMTTMFYFADTREDLY